MHRKVIIGGGGTGGHVFPAISVAHALKSIDPGIEILFVGAKGRLEMEKVPEAGYEIIGLPVSGFQRRVSFRNVTFFYKLIKSMIEAGRIIRRFNPDAVLGVGGYASGPIIRAASRNGIPVVLQEQNSYAGLTNRILASCATTICVAYEGMEKYFPAEKILLTGNPVRRDILDCYSKKNEGLQFFGLSSQFPVVLILGGSLGARTINDTLTSQLERLPDGIQFLWQTGKLYYDNVLGTIKRSGRSDIKVFPFIKEMNFAYGCADVIVSRAGAGTISELAVAGKPSILVPSPNVAGDHQTMNALSLIRKEAALLVKDSEAAEKLIDVINEICGNVDLRTILSENIKKLALPDAAESIALEVIKSIKD